MRCPSSEDNLSVPFEVLRVYLLPCYLGCLLFHFLNPIFEQVVFIAHHLFLLLHRLLLFEVFLKVVGDSPWVLFKINFSDH